MNVFFIEIKCIFINCKKEFYIFLILNKIIDEEEVENLTNNFASSNMSIISQDFNTAEHYTVSFNNLLIC